MGMGSTPKLTQQEQAVAKAKNPFEIFGAPKLTQYESLRDASGNLKSQFAMTPEAGVAEDFASQVRGPGDIQALRTRATTPGLSAQASLQQQALGEQAKNQAQQGMASAWSRLASRGGIDAGARERLARSGQRELGQNLANVGLQTSIEDERQKAQLAQALPGMQLGQESAILSARQGDIARREAARGQNIGLLTGDVAAKQAFEQQRLADQLKALGAEKQAIAEKQKSK